MRAHRQDIEFDDVISRCQLLSLNETNLQDNTTFSLADFPWPSSRCYIANRLQDSQGGARGGGVLVAVSNMNSSLVLRCRQPGVEAVLVNVDFTVTPFYFCSVYRHPHCSRPQLEQALSDIITHITDDSLPCLIVGDFNANQHSSADNDWLSSVMSSFNFDDQHIDKPTTDSGSTIDRVFTRSVHSLDINVADCYYSDHDCLIISVASLL